MGTSATRAKNKYNAKNYDYIRVVVPKGRKDAIKEYATQRLGHEKVETTLNTYSCLYPDKHSQAADKFNKNSTFLVPLQKK